MKARMLLASLFLGVLMLAPANVLAQDEGLPDTVAMVITPPDAGDATPTMVVQLFGKIDSNPVGSVGLAFSWDNPLLQMDSAVTSDEVEADLDFQRFVYVNNRLDSTNSKQQFQMAGFRLSSNGIQPDPDNRYPFATYYFSAPGWTVNDQVTIDTVTVGGSAFEFVTLTNAGYNPVWEPGEGGYVVTDPNAPSATLAVSTNAIAASGLVGGAVDPTSFDVTEAGGGAIAFTVSNSAAWLAPDIANGTTPQTVGLTFNTDGLAAGTYVDTVVVTSAGADGSPQNVEVTLTLDEAARLQIIHNAADPAAASVDIWVNGSPFETSFDFRTATEYRSVPTNTDLIVEITPAGGAYPGDVVATDTFNLPAGTYAVIANGVLDPSNFIANPDGRDISFMLWATGTREAGENGASNVDFIGVHGATDAPFVDITARGVATLLDSVGYGDISDYLSVNAQSYTLDVSTADDPTNVVASFTADLSGLGGGAGIVVASGFLDGPGNPIARGEGFALVLHLSDGSSAVLPAAALPTELVVAPQSLAFTAEEGGANPADQTLSVSEKNGGSVPVQVLESAPWLSVSPPGNNTPFDVTVSVDIAGLDAGTYTDSIRILTPSVDFNGDQWIVVTLEVTPVATPEFASLQIIHNSADEAAASVDIWVNGSPFETGLDFRSATAFNDSVPANTDLIVEITPAGGDYPASVVYTDTFNLAANESYVVIANGLITPGNYLPNPDGRSTAFSLLVVTPAVTTATALDSVTFAAGHGVTDAPTVDVVARDVATLVDNAAFGDVTPYQSVGAQAYTLDVTLGSDNNAVVASFEADLSALGGAAGVILASGFLSSDSNPIPSNPAARQVGNEFALVLHTPAGGPGIVLPAEEVVEFASLQIIHNSADEAATSVDIWVNGAPYQTGVDFRTATAFDDSVPANTDLIVEITPAGGDYPGSVVYTDTFNLMANTAYALIANGLVTPSAYLPNPDGRSTDFSLLVLTPAERQAINDSVFTFAAGHGVTDAPTVDIIARGVGTLVNDATFSDIVPYQSVPAADYVLDVTLWNDSSTIVASFEAALSTLGGGAGIILASGFLNPDSNPIPTNPVHRTVDRNFALVLFLPGGGQGIVLPPFVEVANLSADPTSLSFEAFEGVSTPTQSDDFVVSSTTTDELTIDSLFVLNGSSWVTSVSADGSTTPATVTVEVDSDGLSAGAYIDTVVVYADAAANSPLAVPVTLVVLECPEFVLDFTADTITINEGDSIEYTRTLSLTSSDPQTELFYIASGMVLNVEPNVGSTPDSLIVGLNQRFDTAGTYTFCADIVTDPEFVYSCTDSIQFCLTVVVQEVVPPSIDTLTVATVPAVPGMMVTVPISKNSGSDIIDLSAAFNYANSNVVFETISFEGTLLEGNNPTFFHDDSGDFFSIAGNGMIGSDAGVLANVTFSIRCEAPGGFYPITAVNAQVVNMMTDSSMPVTIDGGIVVDTTANFVCGYVVDPEDNAIEGATVQLWADFPVGSPIEEKLSSSTGSFAFADFTAVPFALYAFAEGYYPALLEDLNFGEKGVKLVLRPLEDLVPTSEWVDYFCDQNTFRGEPLPVGSIVEARTPGNLLVGQFEVTEAGQYGFMPVYRANDNFQDNGARTGESITFQVNGVNAMTTGDIIYPAEYDQVEVCLEAGANVVEICPLLEGWNLVSWPVMTATTDIEAVLADYLDCIDVVLGFEQGGLTFDPDLPQFSTLWNVDGFSGYWIRVKEGCQVTLEIAGMPIPANTPIPVTTGWNLVSYLPDGPLAPVDALASLDETLLYAYGFDPIDGLEIYAPGSEVFNTLTELSRCNGYWLKVSDNDELVYPLDGGNGVPASIAINPNSRSSRPNISTAVAGVTPTTSWVNVYASNLKLDGATVSAGATIKAHAEDGTVAGSFTLRDEGTFGFMPVYGATDANERGLSAGDQFYLSVDGVETEERFDWSENGIRIEVANLSTGTGGEDLPLTFALEQNYPNPFNPTTTISFSVPTASQVRLEVYNVLGKLVAVPYDGLAQAGQQEVVWDGRDLAGNSVASGVYFYRLTAANGWTEARKMMLLK